MFFLKMHVVLGHVYRQTAWLAGVTSAGDAEALCIKLRTHAQIRIK